MMNKPSSTITAATLAGMAAALIWELVATFTGYNPTPGLISGSTVFVSSLVGYLKKEKVMK
jgi:hypothetical protein